MPARVLVVHPPLSVARDFIDYPYFADLGAVQLAAVLRDHHATTLVDAFALAGASLHWRDDGRAHLGASVEAVLAACAGDFDIVVVGISPFHRPPLRDDVLAAVLVGLRAAGRPLVLADLYQSGQHYVEAPADAILAAYPEADAWVAYEGELAIPAIVAGGVASRAVIG
ncbi:MAG TPA: hypothetical protein VG755_35830, partial [Nannocystaceae bacterium]|nr:hypothetical protein [Nannocystaceae bacterium]